MSDKLEIKDVYSYPKSEKLYHDYFSEDGLLAEIKTAQGITDISQDTIIRQEIRKIITAIPFGPVSCVSHEFINGIADVMDTDGEYNPIQHPYTDIQSEISAPQLIGYRISAPSASVSSPRVVITAGVHAREVAPPLAVARFFCQLVVNWVRGSLFFGKDENGKIKYPAITHPSFMYQAGAYIAKDSNNAKIYGPSVGLLEEALTDATPLSPKFGIDAEKNTKIQISSLPFNSSDSLSILEGLEIIVLPVVNPGGRDFVLTAGSESVAKEEARREWRKTRAFLSNTEFNFAEDGPPGAPEFTVNQNGPTVERIVQLRPIGVDINRNADVAWNPNIYYKSGVSYNNDAAPESSRNFQTYIGKKPNSELETCAVIAALRGLNIGEMPDLATYFKNIPPPPPPTPPLREAVPPPAAPPIPKPLYLGALFYLDIHAYGGDVLVPWGIESNGSVREQNFLNIKYDGFPVIPSDDAQAPSHSGYRDGSRGEISLERVKAEIKKPTSNNEYREYFPNAIKFANGINPHFLKKAHMEIFAGPISTDMTAAVSEGATLVPATAASVPPVPPSIPLLDPIKRMSIRSAYFPWQAIALYTTTGTLVDYAFSLNIRGITGLPRNTARPSTLVAYDQVEENLERTGPVIALTLEVGRLQDGGFFPIDAPLPKSTKTYPSAVDTDVEYWSAGQYMKVERETFAAIHKFLLTSIFYAKANP